jgi:Bacterial Ig-like domain (group 3)
VNAGSYAINQGTLALSNNYALTFVSANFVITQAPTTTVIASTLSTSQTTPLKVTFTAAVASWNNLATGTVTFKEGATTLGTFNLASGVPTFTTSTLTTGPHVITASYSGDTNFSGSSSPSNSAPTNVTITTPASGSVFPLTQSVNFAGTFTDTAGKSHTAAWSFDGSASTVGLVTGEANATGSFTFPAGVWGVSLAVNDKVGGVTISDSIGGFQAMVVVYDPNGGFVTGGGWINSPPGAYMPNPGLTGKANFGFVSKYQKGATIPTGETEFQFKVGDLNFHSTVYEWLVVAGAKAQYKGSGTINGTGDYGFLLTATDGDLNGGGGTDKFRIKIVDKSTGLVAYDNVPGGSDDIDTANPLAIGGGSIVIHK